MDIPLPGEEIPLPPSPPPLLPSTPIDNVPLPPPYPAEVPPLPENADIGAMSSGPSVAPLPPDFVIGPQIPGPMYGSQTNYPTFDSHMNNSNFPHQQPPFFHGSMVPGMSAPPPPGVFHPNPPLPPSMPVHNLSSVGVSSETATADIDESSRYSPSAAMFDSDSGAEDGGTLGAANNCVSASLEPIESDAVEVQAKSVEMPKKLVPVLGKEQAKKRLMAFSSMKMARHNKVLAAAKQAIKSVPVKATVDKEIEPVIPSLPPRVESAVFPPSNTCETSLSDSSPPAPAAPSAVSATTLETEEQRNNKKREPLLIEQIMREEEQLKERLNLGPAAILVGNASSILSMVAIGSDTQPDPRYPPAERVVSADVNLLSSINKPASVAANYAAPQVTPSTVDSINHVAALSAVASGRPVAGGAMSAAAAAAAAAAVVTGKLNMARMGNIGVGMGASGDSRRSCERSQGSPRRRSRSRSASRRRRRSTSRRRRRSYSRGRRRSSTPPRRRRPSQLPINWQQYKEEGYEPDDIRVIRSDLLRRKRLSRQRRGDVLRYKRRRRQRRQYSRSDSGSSRSRSASSVSRSESETEEIDPLLRPEYEHRQITYVSIVGRSHALTFPREIIRETQTKPHLSYSESLHVFSRVKNRQQVLENVDEDRVQSLRMWWNQLSDTPQVESYPVLRGRQRTWLTGECRLPDVWPPLVDGEGQTGLDGRDMVGDTRGSSPDDTERTEEAMTREVTESRLSTLKGDSPSQQEHMEVSSSTETGLGVVTDANAELYGSRENNGDECLRHSVNGRSIEKRKKNKQSHGQRSPRVQKEINEGSVPARENMMPDSNFAQDSEECALQPMSEVISKGDDQSIEPREKVGFKRPKKRNRVDKKTEKRAKKKKKTSRKISESSDSDSEDDEPSEEEEMVWVESTRINQTGKSSAPSKFRSNADVKKKKKKRRGSRSSSSSGSSVRRSKKKQSHRRKKKDHSTEEESSSSEEDGQTSRKKRKKKNKKSSKKKHRVDRDRSSDDEEDGSAGSAGFGSRCRQTPGRSRHKESSSGDDGERGSRRTGRSENRRERKACDFNQEKTAFDSYKSFSFTADPESDFYPVIKSTEAANSHTVVVLTLQMAIVIVLSFVLTHSHVFWPSTHVCSPFGPEFTCVLVNYCH